MLSWIMNILQWLFSFWEKLPNEVKELIIKNAAKAMEEVFRWFYRANKSEETANDNT